MKIFATICLILSCSINSFADKQARCSVSKSSDKSSNFDKVLFDDVVKNSEYIIIKSDGVVKLNVSQINQSNVYSFNGAIVIGNMVDANGNLVLEYGQWSLGLNSLDYIFIDSKVGDNKSVSIFSTAKNFSISCQKL